MPLGLNINNPQEENPVAGISPTIGGQANTYAGNALGTGASTSSSSPSNILIYGAIGLAVIFILKKIDQ